MRQNYHFQLLAPPQTRPDGTFGRCKINEQLYGHYLASMQRLRGQVYLKDGAIQPCELDDEDRFRMRGDEQSWHFLLVEDDQNVIGCARYLVHPNTVSFHKLRIAEAAQARDPYWGQRVRQAVEADLRRARACNQSYVEIGGWALAEEWRGTKAALEILVASYALAHLWGGCIASCMATVRHCSSSILRRIGGTSLQIGGETVPPYQDPHYGCLMEMLRFDSNSPVQRFLPLIDQLKSKLGNSTVIRARKEEFSRSFPLELGTEHVSFLRHGATLQLVVRP
jgi:predicted GNAT family N-acyltransferase